MTSAIDRIIDDLLAKEGGYVNDPRDAGGETNWGITKGTARRWGYTGPMRTLTKERARLIYEQEYIVRPGFGAVLAIAPLVAAELVDTGVNMGPAIAAQMLQRLLNALNRGGKDYPDILADGDVGDGTLAALRSFMRVRGKPGEAILVRGLNCLQGERYVDLAEKRPANEAFLYGWLANRCA